MFILATQQKELGIFVDVWRLYQKKESILYLGNDTLRHGCVTRVLLKVRVSKTPPALHDHLAEGSLVRIGSTASRGQDMRNLKLRCVCSVCVYSTRVRPERVNAAVCGNDTALYGA